ncbi:MAG TPA: LytTR family DNA-binding domain-containing protein [Candidatus Saccharimonadales bacterium]|nr:LytTR family DNA-binding domain-containing protein [Candidatus Saccharimonadales bacterium]
MKLRVLIADDEALARDRLRTFLEMEPDVEIVAECHNGAEAVACIRKAAPDLVFLDIRMPEMDAFAVLGSLEGCQLPAIIFVTAHAEYAVPAFKAQALDYLLKPFDRDRFQDALNHARKGLPNDHPLPSFDKIRELLDSFESDRTAVDRLTVRAGHSLKFIKVGEVNWMQGADNYVELHTGSSVHMLRQTLAGLEAQLAPGQFIRISRSIIVNLDRVKEIHSKPHGDYSVVLHDGTQLNGSRSYRAKLKEHLNGKSKK